MAVTVGSPLICMVAICNISVMIFTKSLIWMVMLAVRVNLSITCMVSVSVTDDPEIVLTRSLLVNSSDRVRR